MKIMYVQLLIFFLYSIAFFSQTNTWVYKSNMPTARTFLSSCVVDNKLYVIGGAPTQNATTKMEMYDPVIDIWSTLPDMPAARLYAMVCNYNGLIYVFGGGTSYWTNAVKDIFVYDPLTAAWTQVTGMPYAVGGSAIAVVGNLIYIIGGAVSPSSPPFNTVMAYDPNTETWTQKTSMPTPRNGITASVHDGKIYVIGGTTENWGNIFYTKVEMYDPVTDTWTQKADMPTGRWGMTSCTVDGLIYVIGGRNSYSLSENEVYNPNDDSWSTQSPMQLLRTWPTGGAIENKIYITGGHFQGPPMLMLNSLEEFTPELTDLEEQTNKTGPDEFSLFQNYPNPFNPNTKISWQSSIGSWQTIKIYDVLGNEIATLVNEEKEAGYHSIDFSASDLRSGVYFYQLRAGWFVETRKMILIR